MAAPFALVLVPDVELRPTALGIVRCLGRVGVPVAVAAASAKSPSYSSRYATQRLLCPPLEQQPDAWKDALITFARSFPEPPVLYVSSDEHVLAVHRYRDEISPFVRYLFLDRDALVACLDKRRMYAACKAAGIEVGRLVIVEKAMGPDDLARDVVFPSVLKPAMWADVTDPRPRRNRSFLEEFGQKAVTVRTRTELDDIHRRAARISIPVLLQEHVPGPASAIVHVSLYADRTSATRGAFVGRKTRQFPSEFGNACMVQTAASADAAALAALLVKTIGFHGIAGAIEFKRHPETGALHFIEINPRSSASISLTAAAGVNLPHLAYLDALGQPLPGASLGDRPVSWIEGRSDFRYWLSYRKGDHTGQPLSLLEYLGSLRGPRDYAYWAADDMRPWLTRISHLPGDLARAFAGRAEPHASTPR